MDRKLTGHAGFQGTEDVRLDPLLNKEVWKQGIKGVPYRLRVRISRKRNDEEGAKERLFSYVQAVNVANPKGLQTTVVSAPRQLGFCGGDGSLMHTRRLRTHKRWIFLFFFVDLKNSKVHGASIRCTTVYLVGIGLASGCEIHWGLWKFPCLVKWRLKDTPLLQTCAVSPGQLDGWSSSVGDWSSMDNICAFVSSIRKDHRAIDL